MRRMISRKLHNIVPKYKIYTKEQELSGGFKENMAERIGRSC